MIASGRPDRSPSHQPIPSMITAAVMDIVNHSPVHLQWQQLKREKGFRRRPLGGSEPKCSVLDHPVPIPESSSSRCGIEAPGGTWWEMYADVRSCGLIIPDYSHTCTQHLRPQPAPAPPSPSQPRGALHCLPHGRVP